MFKSYSLDQRISAQWQLKAKIYTRVHFLKTLQYFFVTDIEFKFGVGVVERQHQNMNLVENVCTCCWSEQIFSKISHGPWVDFN